MKEIREAILDKVRAEAREIVEKAEEEAAHIVAEAKEQREQALAAEKEKSLREARDEAAQITARGAMDARNALAAAKAEVFEGIVSETRGRLRSTKPEAEEYARLIAEAVSGLGSGDRITVVVPPGCRAAAREAVKKDEPLSERVAEIEEREMEGGIIAESEDKSIVVDNTYSARLEMLLPRVYVGFAEKLFGETEA